MPKKIPDNGLMIDNKIKKRIKKTKLFKDAAIEVMKDSTEFDSTIVKSNDDYIIKLQEADSQELEILRENLEKADTTEEREAIRKRIAEMQKNRYEKDTENKKYLAYQQESHKNHNLKILTAIAVTAGLVYKFGKPILGVTHKLIGK